MNCKVAAGLIGLVFGLANGIAFAQVAGSSTVGIAVTEVQEVAIGLSVKKQILGQVIYNDADEKIGKIDDLIIGPDDSASFVVVGVGGFVGIRRHRVAVPVEFLVPREGGFVLAGATKEALKDLPTFEYFKPVSRAEHNPIFIR